MTDEKFTFIEDLRDKKKTATGAYHKRTHCGKGGAVKFPSDFMTKKEIAAMNGEVKSYKLNGPMTWAEFKAMPDDIKIVYIKALREKFDVADTKIALMLGVGQKTVSNETRRLGIPSTSKGKQKWDVDSWTAWLNGVPKKEEVPKETLPIVEPDVPKPASEEVIYEPPKMFAPESGELTFTGKSTDALATVALLLGEANVRLNVTWEAVRNED